MEFNYSSDDEVFTDGHLVDDEDTVTDEATDSVLWRSGREDIKQITSKGRQILRQVS